MQRDDLSLTCLNTYDWRAGQTKSMNTCSYLFLPDGKMELERTISEKGQVVIPKDMRKQLGLKPGSEILFEVNGKSVIIRPKKTQGSLSKSLQP